MSITLGIDPGHSGAIAMVDSYGELVEVHDMPVVDKAVSPHLLTNLICNMGVSRVDLQQMVGMCVVEHVHSMPRQGVASSFRFGAAFGVACGVIGGLELPITLVRPNKWKRDMGLNSDKERSRRTAIERWPTHAHDFRLKKHDGRAEAALLALWWIERGDR